MVSRKVLRSALAAIAAVAALVVGLYLAAPRESQGPPATGPGSPTPTSTLGTSPGATATSARVADGRYGIVVQEGQTTPGEFKYTVQSETAPGTVVMTIPGASVSLDGRRIAFVERSGPSYEIRAVDTSSPSQTRTLVSSGEQIGGLVWSSDGRALAFAVHGPARGSVLEFAALRIVDLGTQQVREVYRYAPPPGRFLLPSGWDSASRTIGAVEIDVRGSFMAGFLSIREGGSVSRTEPDALGSYAMSLVNAHSDRVSAAAIDHTHVRVWSIANYADGKVITAPSNERWWGAWLRPGSSELLVLVGPRTSPGPGHLPSEQPTSLVLIGLVDGRRQELTLVSSGRPLLLRHDGTALYLGTLTVDQTGAYATEAVTVYDIATGRSEDIGRLNGRLMGSAHLP